ncbi:hypothetical protein GCM10009801_53730 [Streptomyces albiaxialis]|uniref:FHA domain-containing protein n=1 Tax=Streptomyces albiaxialis TaxID=329523 RepID=A0ABN2WCQ8_9ACTN
MPTCPNGHQSAADDWCEVCGHRMTHAPAAPAGAVPPPPPPPPAHGGGYGYPGPGGPGQQGGPPPGPGVPGQGYGYPGPGSPGGEQGARPELCPQCGTPREVQAPFCEECRYNFLTHSPTTYVPHGQQQGPGPGQQGPPPGGPGGFPPPGGQQPYPGHHDQGQGQGHDPGLDYERSRPSQMNRPAEPLPYGDPGQQGPPPGQGAQPSGDWVLSPPPGGQQGYPGAPPSPHQDYGQQGPGQQGPPPFPQQQHQQPPQPDYGQPDYGQQGPGSWVAVIAPDREYFTAMMGRSGPEAAALNLPAYSPEQQLPLTGNQITIGRRRASTGEAPDIDLARQPEDPGVSHQHAVLVQQPDGSWSVVDQDSTNGTTINGAEDPIQPFVPVPLKEGDRVHVGAWTTITLHRG